MKNDFRQQLHLEPPRGWLNDPNGLCYFNGAYHVYFQYAPDSPEGKGNKCWGHWESKDLLSWRFTGTVLFPDTPEDRNGVYSGCGFVRDDTLYLFYTGNVKEPGDHDYVKSGRGANVILVLTNDGHTMSGKRVLLRNADYPSYCSCHVRDPKVWQENGRYYMVLGARTLDDKGCVLYYRSDDLIHWDFDHTLFGDDGSYMWECPDEFTLGGRRRLSTSPQGVPHERFAFQNVYSAGYFTIENGKAKTYREWDKGFDFYAPQTFDAPDGRKLLIAWEGIGDIPYSNPTVSLGRQHCLTLPRELAAGNDGVIFQIPARELESLRKSRTDLHGAARTQAPLPFEFLGESSGDFLLTLEDVFSLTYRNGVVSLAFTNEQAGCGRTKRCAQIEKLRRVRMIADRSSVEIYLNDGEIVMSSRMYPPNTETILSLDGIHGELYELESMRFTYEQ